MMWYTVERAPFPCAPEFRQRNLASPLNPYGSKHQHAADKFFGTQVIYLNDHIDTIIHIKILAAPPFCFQHWSMEQDRDLPMWFMTNNWPWEPQMLLWCRQSYQPHSHPQIGSIYCN